MVAMSAGRSERVCNTPWPESHGAPLAFQLAGAVGVNTALGEGGLRVHTKSAGLGWFRQISSVAAVSVFRLQFWLSHVTDTPVSLLSGMRLPELAGRAAHKAVESQAPLKPVTLSCVEGVEGVEGELPPPQLAKRVLRARQVGLQRGDRMHAFAGLGCLGEDKSEAARVTKQFNFAPLSTVCKNSRDARFGCSPVQPGQVLEVWR